MIKNLFIFIIALFLFTGCEMDNNAGDGDSTGSSPEITGINLHPAGSTSTITYQYLPSADVWMEIIVNDPDLDVDKFLIKEYQKDNPDVYLFSTVDCQSHPQDQELYVYFLEGTLSDTEGFFVIEVTAEDSNGNRSNTEMVEYETNNLYDF